MTVVLDCALHAGWERRYTETEIGRLSDADLGIEAMPGDLIGIVNGTDLSWRDQIPMLDFARSLFLAAVALSPTNLKERFILPELFPWLMLVLDKGDIVTASREDEPVTATCSRMELVTAAAAFGVKVYNLFSEVYPSVRTNGFFSSWYPLSEMRAYSIMP
jgi:hypothetical protein